MNCHNWDGNRMSCTKVQVVIWTLRSIVPIIKNSLKLKEILWIQRIQSAKFVQEWIFQHGFKIEMRCYFRQIRYKCAKCLERVIMVRCIRVNWPRKKLCKCHMKSQSISCAIFYIIIIFKNGTYFKYLRYIWYYYRYTVAIKCSLHGKYEESIHDEAKSMIQIYDYHNHIVNLQGIFFETNQDADGIPKVLKVV